MSSVREYPSFAGFNAVDGIYLPSDSGLGELASLAHSLKELSPWIQVDLATNHFVQGVRIWNRSEHLTHSESIKAFS